MIKKILSCLPMLAFLSGCGSSPIQIDQFKVLGAVEFTQAQWRAGNESARAKMFHSFLKKNEPIENLTRDSIVKSLGSNTGYYLYDEFPAYYLDIGKDKPLLVSFVIDHDTNTVNEIYLDSAL